VRAGGPKPQFTPTWLARRYEGRRVGQICRVWVDPGHRRLGVGRLLATGAARWALGAGYDPVCLHTNASIPGALAFWSSFPGAVLVHDARPDPWSTVHFEIDPAAFAATADLAA
jgi:GNAT superfamily N-acetyltransferase